MLVMLDDTCKEMDSLMKQVARERGVTVAGLMKQCVMK